MILPLYVFTLPVFFLFFKLYHYPNIITIQVCGQYSQGNYLKCHQELSKSKGSLCCFKSSNILSFYSGVNNTRLLHTSPTNSPPPRVNTNPKIDLRESLSDQKFKFVYPRYIKYRLYRFSHFWFFMFYCVLVVSIYSWCIGNMPPFFKMLFMYITILNSIFVHLQRNKEELYE